jgi:hypothetical protein
MNEMNEANETPAALFLICFFALGERVKYHPTDNTLDKNGKRNDRRKFPLAILNLSIGSFGNTSL